MVSANARFKLGSRSEELKSSLRRRRSEVVGERENGRARRRLKNWEQSVFKKLDFVPVFIVTRVICLQITLSHVIPLSEQNVIDNLHE